VVDLNLPRINGHTVLEFLKSRPGPPVVVFSVSANPRDRKRALDLGARDYVVKPRTRDELFATVRKMVELRFGRPRIRRQRHGLIRHRYIRS